MGFLRHLWNRRPYTGATAAQGIEDLNNGVKLFIPV